MIKNDDGTFTDQSTGNRYRLELRGGDYVYLNVITGRTLEEEKRDRENEQQNQKPTTEKSKKTMTRAQAEKLGRNDPKIMMERMTSGKWEVVDD